MNNITFYSKAFEEFFEENIILIFIFIIDIMKILFLNMISLNSFKGNITFYLLEFLFSLWVTVFV